MERNWLIRTQAKRILGPVEKSKVLELIEEKALTDEDEVSSGNGHWFWIREKDLVEKYLYGQQEQPFDPISEVQSVLGEHAGKGDASETDVEETAVVNREMLIPTENREDQTEDKSDPAPPPQEKPKKRPFKEWIVSIVIALVLVAVLFFLRPLL